MTEDMKRGVVIGYFIGVAITLIVSALMFKTGMI